MSCSHPFVRPAHEDFSRGLGGHTPALPGMKAPGVEGAVRPSPDHTVQQRKSFNVPTDRFDGRRLRRRTTAIGKCHVRREVAREMRSQSRQDQRLLQVLPKRLQGRRHLRAAQHAWRLAPVKTCGMIERQFKGHRMHLACGGRGSLDDVFAQHRMITKEMQRGVITRGTNHPRAQMLRRHNSVRRLLDMAAGGFVRHQGEEQAMDLGGGTGATTEQVRLDIGRARSAGAHAEDSQGNRHRLPQRPGFLF